MWFKVTIGGNGAVRQCERVSMSQEDGEDVFYVEASTKGEAIMAAKQLARCRSKLRRRQKEVLKRCRECSRPVKPGRKKCPGCLSADVERRNDRYRRLKEAGRSMHDRLPDHLHRGPYRGGRKGRSNVSVELEVLRSVWDAFDSMSSASFREWLIREVSRREEAEAGEVSREGRWSGADQAAAQA